MTAEQKMPKPSKALGAGILVGTLGVLLVLAVVGLFVVYTGAFNVAATEEHASLTRWAFDTTFHRSVETRADDIEPPADLMSRVEQGAGEYKHMCQHCHGGPGVTRAEWASGIRPRPPHLAEAFAVMKVVDALLTSLPVRSHLVLHAAPRV